MSSNVLKGFSGVAPALQGVSIVADVVSLVKTVVNGNEIRRKNESLVFATCDLLRHVEDFERKEILTLLKEEEDKELKSKYIQMYLELFKPGFELKREIILSCYNDLDKG